MKLIVVAVLSAITTILIPTVAFAQEDVTPPTLLDVRFEPEIVDTSKGPATITVTVHVTDDLSGVDHVALHFHKPGTTQRAQVEFRDDEGWSEIIEGDRLDGIHVATMTLPQYTAYGEWEMNAVSLSDNVGNHVYFSRPEGQEENEHQKDGATNDQWPSLFNGFHFAVGTADTPQQPERRLYLPALAM